MAQGIAEKISKECGKEIEIKSAGLFADTNSPASKNAIAAMSEMGIDISNHKAQQLSIEDVITADKIYTMTEGHRLAIISEFPSLADKVLTLGENKDVLDPFGRDLETYKLCAKEISEHIKRIFKDISNDGNT